MVFAVTKDDADSTVRIRPVSPGNNTSHFGKTVTPRTGVRREKPIQKRCQEVMQFQNEKLVNSRVRPLLGRENSKTVVQESISGRGQREMRPAIAKVGRCRISVKCSDL